MKDDIIRWMKEFVEVPHPNFGNFAPCPYAKEARIENKIKFVEFPNSRPDSDIEPYVRNMMLDEFDVTILIFEILFPTISLTHSDDLPCVALITLNPGPQEIICRVLSSFKRSPFI